MTNCGKSWQLTVYLVTMFEVIIGGQVAKTPPFELNVNDNWINGSFDDTIVGERVDGVVICMECPKSVSVLVYGSDNTVAILLHQCLPVVETIETYRDWEPEE